MRMLITYVVIIPVAILMGYLLTNPLDYGTLGFIGLIAALLISPIFIRWNYPILVFGLACPMVCFFLMGKPPSSQVVVVISLTVAILNRILSSEHRFISSPVVGWPLLFLAAVVYFTAEMNGGIQLHAVGGDTGGGRKYLDVFVGVGTYFALTSQTIPRKKWHFYIALYYLPHLLGVISDLFPYLPSPLNQINLLFPPMANYAEGVVLGKTRLISVCFAMGAVTSYMLARYGLRGILSFQNPIRMMIFGTAVILSFLGGFRNVFIGLTLMLTFMFFVEGLHRTRLMPLGILAGILGAVMLISFSDHLPFTFQRSMSFLPLKWDSEAVLSAQSTTDWRLNIWRSVWPKVPEYLLLGKGYTLTRDDYQMIGDGQFAMQQMSHVEGSDEALAISSDFHNGPLSTLIPFGIWGGIGMLWLMGAVVHILYRNFKYGETGLLTLNTFLLASCVVSIISFFLIFGAFQGDVGSFGALAGFSIAMNGGVGKRPAKATSNPRIKPLPKLPLPIANGPVPI